jgi:hypothetical protein
MLKIHNFKICKFDIFHFLFSYNNLISAVETIELACTLKLRIWYNNRSEPLGKYQGIIRFTKYRFIKHIVYVLGMPDGEKTIYFTPCAKKTVIFSI